MLLFYIPCPNKESAQDISRTLLSEKLVACANIIPGMQSMYWWDGKIETSSECILILKTLKTSDAQEIITNRVLELHPYKTPAVIAIPVLGVNASYQSWLAASLGKR